MARRKLPLSKTITLGAMVTSLSVLCLFAGGMFPYLRLPLVIFASICAYVLICEGAYVIAILSFAACSLLSFFLISEKSVVFMFILFFGHYGIIRGIITNYINSKVLRLLLKLLYFNICAALGIYLVQNLLAQEIALPVSVYIFVALLELAFIAYDVIYSLCVTIYDNRLRRALMPRR